MKALGNCTEIGSKRQKLQIYRHFPSQLEALFSITNCIYLSTKAHQNNEAFHCLRVLTFYPLSISIILQKLQKNFESLKTLGFCHFRCQFQIFFKSKTAIISL